MYVFYSFFGVQVCEDDQGEPLAFSSGVPSTFDEKLDFVLSKPYDRSEYEDLLRKATERKPVSRQRILRSASKHYATDIVGLSYLDHYRGGYYIFFGNDFSLIDLFHCCSFIVV